MKKIRNEIASGRIFGPRNDAYRVCIILLGCAMILTSTLGCASSKANKKPARPPYEKVKFISAADLKEERGVVENYHIEVDDVLEISVWQIEDLHREVVVRPDGKISFPLIGDVDAKGKAIEELRTDIVDKIKMYIKVPQVSVNIKEFGGKRAVILGQINSPGVIRFASPIRISEAIALSSGFTTDAYQGAVFIVRDLNTEQPTVIVARVNEIFFKGDLSEDILIRAGDVIYVQTSVLASVRDFMNNTFAPLVGYVDAYYGFTWPRMSYIQGSGRKLRYPTVTTQGTQYQWSGRT